MISRRPPSTACHRIPAGDAFAENGQVRLDPKVALRAAHAQPEPGDHFIKDEQRAKLVAQLAHLLVEVKGNTGVSRFPVQPVQDDRRRAATQTIQISSRRK